MASAVWAKVSFMAPPVSEARSGGGLGGELRCCGRLGEGFAEVYFEVGFVAFGLATVDEIVVQEDCAAVHDAQAITVAGHQGVDQGGGDVDNDPAILEFLTLGIGVDGLAIGHHDVTEFGAGPGPGFLRTRNRRTRRWRRRLCRTLGQELPSTQS